MHACVPFVVELMNVLKLRLSATSVRISWDIIEVSAYSIYSIQGYVVYYNKTENRKKQSEEGSVTVPNDKDNVVIEDLEKEVEYLFLVAATFELHGDVVTGLRFPAMTAPETRKLLLYETYYTSQHEIWRDIS